MLCRARLELFVSLFALVQVVASRGLAQQPVAGEGSAALPAVLTLGVPEVGPSRLAVAAGGHYGYLEAMRDDDASRSRLSGELALGARVLPWLSLALGSRLQQDTRGGSFEQPVDAVSMLRFAVRASARVRGTGRLGIELVGVTPSGTDASPAFGATSIEARGLAGFTLGARTICAGLLGIRLDRSKHAVDASSALVPAQRIAAGLSDFDALLLGLGLSHRLDATELLAELRANVLVGSSSALLGSSALSASIGTRYHAGRAVQLELSLAASPSARPRLRAIDPLVSIEPRVDVALGVRVAWDGSSAHEQEPAPDAHPPAPPPPSVQAAAVAPPPVVAPPPIAPEPAEPAPPAAETVAAADASSPEKEAGPGQGMAQVRGHVRAFSGEPLEASATFYPRGLKANADAQGYFELELPPGKYTVRLRAYGYQSQNRRVQADADGVTILNVELRKK